MRVRIDTGREFRQTLGSLRDRNIHDLPQESIDPRGSLANRGKLEPEDVVRTRKCRRSYVHRMGSRGERLKTTSDTSLVVNEIIYKDFRSECSPPEYISGALGLPVLPRCE